MSKKDEQQKQAAREDAEAAAQEAAERAKDSDAQVTGAGGGVSAGASAPSQYQSTSAEPEQQELTPEELAEQTGEPVFFDTSVTKVDEEGNQVLSDHLVPGEVLHRTTTARKAEEAAQARREATAKQNDGKQNEDGDK